MDRLTEPQRVEIRTQLAANVNTEAGKYWKSLDLNKLSDSELIGLDVLRRRMVPTEAGIPILNSQGQQIGKQVWNPKLLNNCGDFETILFNTPTGQANNCGCQGNTTVAGAGVVGSGVGNNTGPSRTNPWSLDQLVANGLVNSEGVLVINLAKQVKEQATQQLIDRLTANIDPGMKDQAVQVYRTYKYEDLEKLAALMPAIPAQPIQNQQPLPVPSWAGAQGPAAGQVVNTQPALDLPKYDWAAISAPRTGRA